MTIANRLVFDSTGYFTAVDDLTSDTWSGPIDLENDANAFEVASGNTFTLAGQISGDIGPAGEFAAWGNNTGTAANGGTLVLSSDSNSFTGFVSVAGETVRDASNNAIPSTDGVEVQGEGTFDLAGFDQTLTEITGGNGTITSSSGSPALTLTLPGAVSDDYNGTLTGSLSLVIDGPGSTFELAYGGTNSYTGTTTVEAGTLESVAALPATTVLNVAASATCDLDGHAQQLGAITSGSGTITDSGAAESLTVGPLTAADPAGETLSGPISLVVDGGSYELTLSGRDTYTGTTTVNTGSLEVTGELADSEVTVAPGATLGGTGTVDGIIADSADSTVQPGSGPTSQGTLTSSSGVDLAASDFGVVLAGPVVGDYSQLDVSSGSVTLTGASLELSLAGFTPSVGESFDILQNSGGQAITGTFSGLAQGTKFSSDGQTFQISYDGGSSGHDVVVTDVSLPAVPSDVTATAGNASATVSFDPPTGGGSPITGYTVTATDVSNLANGGQSASGSSSPITISGLTNGDTYTFAVTAIDAEGNGPSSGSSNPVTPSTVPGSPTAVTATENNGLATVTWSAPLSDGGIPITGYTVTFRRPNLLDEWHDELRDRRPNERRQLQLHRHRDELGWDESGVGRLQRHHVTPRFCARAKRDCCRRSGFAGYFDDGRGRGYDV
jgi:autotransporter-associated beta strand protein